MELDFPYQRPSCELLDRSLDILLGIEGKGIGYLFERAMRVVPDILIDIPFDVCKIGFLPRLELAGTVIHAIPYKVLSGKSVLPPAVLALAFPIRMLPIGIFESEDFPSPELFSRYVNQFSHTWDIVQKVYKVFVKGLRNLALLLDAPLLYRQGDA